MQKIYKFGLFFLYMEKRGWVGGRGIIAVDLGGTNLRISLVRRGKILEYKRMLTPKTKEALIKEMFGHISEFMDKEGKNIYGIGIASPGPLKNGVIINPENIPLKNYDLKEAVRKKFGVKAEVENDANCVALAEAELGVKKKNFFVLTLGTGVGGGVIIDGKLLGKSSCGAELGHIYLTPEKDFEELVGAKAINRMAQKAFGKNILISDLVKMNNSKSRDILESISEYLGQGIGSLINVFNPEITVLAGGMRHAGEGFLNRIKEKTKKYIMLPGKFEIAWTKLEHPGTLGASLLLDLPIDIM